MLSTSRKCFNIGKTLKLENLSISILALIISSTSSMPFKVADYFDLVSRWASGLYTNRPSRAAPLRTDEFNFAQRNTMRIGTSRRDCGLLGCGSDATLPASRGQIG